MSGVVDHDAVARRADDERRRLGLGNRPIVDIAATLRAAGVKLVQRRLGAAAWRLGHWGSAAEPADSRVSQEDGSLRYDFYGQPPIALVRFLAKARSSLRFHLAWCDPNGRYAGQLVASATGETLREARGVDGMINVLAGTSLQAEVRDYFAEVLGE